MISNFVRIELNDKLCKMQSLDNNKIEANCYKKIQCNEYFLTKKA